MKILMVNKFYYLKGGAEKHFFDLKKLLEERGHKVIPFAMKDKCNFPTSYEKYFVSNINFSQVKFNLTALRIPFRMIYSLEAKRKIASLIRKEKPDIVHLHNIYHQISPSILSVIKKFNLPIVMTVHDFSLVSPNYNLYCSREKRSIAKETFFHLLKHKTVKHSYLASLLAGLTKIIHNLLKIYEKNIDLLICPSKFLKEKLDQNKINIAKVVLPNFIDISKIKPDYSFKKYILFVGRLEEEKGVLNLIKAFENIKTDFCLHIVGEGREYQRLKKYLLDKKLDQIKLKGYLKEDELKREFSQAAFLVLPSLVDEIYPQVILEAYAYGKPVIATNKGGILELIEERKTGFLYSSHNIFSLKEKIEFLLKKPDLIKEMGQRARDKVEKENSPKAYYLKLQKIYSQVLLDRK